MDWSPMYPDGAATARDGVRPRSPSDNLGLCPMSCANVVGPSSGAVSVR